MNQCFEMFINLFHIAGSNSHCVSGGSIGDDFASIGFDGKDIWLGGNHFSGNSHQTVSSSPKVPRLSRQQVYTHKLEFINGIKLKIVCVHFDNRIMFLTLA